MVMEAQSEGGNVLIQYEDISELQRANFDKQCIDDHMQDSAVCKS